MKLSLKIGIMMGSLRKMKKGQMMMKFCRNPRLFHIKNPNKRMEEICHLINYTTKDLKNFKISNFKKKTSLRWIISLCRDMLDP